MEIRGEEFIKKVQLKQEKDEIEQRLNEINDAESIYKEPAERTAPPKLDKEIEIQEEQEYSDIILGSSGNNELNKKKYLILGLVLVILFLLTIIIIRLLTNDSTENDSFSKSQNNASEKILANENIEEQYQKIINEKLKNIQQEKEKIAANEEKIDEKLNLEKIEEKEQVDSLVKETKSDVFNVKKEENTYVPTKKVALEEPKIVPVVKKVVKKATKPIAKKTTSSTITTKPKGTFVQIGAFSKMPSKNYLSTITKNGFKYKIYKVTINNKLFHKVIIGPYNSRGQAKLATDNIKKKLNVSGAFILTF